MEKRFVIFLVIALAIWTGYLGLRFYLAPPPPPVAQRPAEQEKPEAKEKKPAAADKTDEKASADDPAEAKVDAAQADKAPLQRVAIGSLGVADAPYSMGIVFTTRGAAIERAELNTYRDISDGSGYLGYLALTDSPDGCRVNVVVPGTPADKAKSSTGKITGGLAVGDVIEAVDKVATPTMAAFDKYLQTRKPNQKIDLTVARKTGDQSTTLQFTATLVRRPLELLRPESHLYELPDGRKRAYPNDPLSLLLTLETLGAKTLKSTDNELRGLPSLYNSNWTIDKQGPDFVDFSYTLDEAALENIGLTGSLKLIKHYRLVKPSKPGDKRYHLDLQIEVQNLGTEAQKVAYRLDGPTGLPLEGWWYSNKLHPAMWDGAGARDVAWRLEGGPHHLLGCPRIYSESKVALEAKNAAELNLLATNEPSAIDYVGVDTQFFAAMIKPLKSKEGKSITFRKAVAMPVQDIEFIPKRRIKMMNVSTRIVTTTANIEAGQSLKHDYQIFLGPKEPGVLEQYGLIALIEYGWAYAAWPARVLLAVLEFLHHYVAFGNYGVAIILLTLIVRACMVPLSLKQAKSAAKMQELAPEMAKLKEKYADNMEKQSQALRELYAKHNFNPFGGCLLVFFQLPIFVGLYRCLSVDIELRDAALFPGWEWASNLAGPDKLFYWKDWAMMPGFIADEADGWLGPFFNVLPLITVTLFLIQQKLFTPPATDEQTKMQQQMMTYMTVFMGVMFYKVPAGLCLYFITSSLWGICERKLLPKSKPVSATSSTTSVATKPTSTNGSSTKSSGKKQKKRH